MVAASGGFPPGAVASLMQWRLLPTLWHPGLAQRLWALVS